MTPLTQRRGFLAGSAALCLANRAFAQTAPSPKVTEPLSAFIAGSQTATIPEDIRELGRRHILDTLAAIVACRDLAPARLARAYVVAQADGSVATILGSRQKASLTDAVFAGAMTAHAAEINDFIPSAFVQPGPAIVSAAIALAETRGKSGDAVLRAVITGYELAGRMPKALGVQNMRRAGLANHGVGPVFGTAAAAASLLGLSSDRIADVLSYCAEQASGSWQWSLDVEHVEKAFVFAGMGARNGLQAALMVEAGFRGVRDSMDNPQGWMASSIFTGGDANRASLIEGLGKRSELSQTGFKRYPTGGPAQPAVAGLLQLLPQIDRAKVQRVIVAMPGDFKTFRDAAMPALNLPYLCAIILIDGRLDFTAAQSLERMAGDARVKALMAKVEVIGDPSQEAPSGQPRAESARVTVVEGSGARREAFTPYVPGYPSHPLDRPGVEAKALALMMPSLGARRAKAVVDQVWALDSLKTGGRLAGLIAR